MGTGTNLIFAGLILWSLSRPRKAVAAAPPKEAVPNGDGTAIPTLLPTLTQYLNQIAAATSQSELNTVRAGFEADYQAMRITYEEYQDLFSAYMSRYYSLPTGITEGGMTYAPEVEAAFEANPPPGAVYFLPHGFYSVGGKVIELSPTWYYDLGIIPAELRPFVTGG